MFTDALRFQRPSSSSLASVQTPRRRRINPTMVDSVNGSSAASYSSSSSSGSSVCMDMCCDIGNEQYYRKLLRKERRMVLETAYSLNGVWTVIVGSSPARDFTPVIKLTRDPDAAVVLGSIDSEMDEDDDDNDAGKCRSVVIPIEDWDLIIDYLKESEKFLRDNDSADGEEADGSGVGMGLQRHVKTIFDFTLSRQIFLDRKCIKIEIDDTVGDHEDDDDSDDVDDNDAEYENHVRCIYLNADTVLTLLSLTPILNSHLTRLNRLGLCDAYHKILTVLAKMSASAEEEGAPIFMDRFKMMSSVLPLEPSLKSAMLEIVRFHSAALYNDYERHIKVKGLAGSTQSPSQLHHHLASPQ